MLYLFGFWFFDVVFVKLDMSLKFKVFCKIYDGFIGNGVFEIVGMVKVG